MHGSTTDPDRALIRQGLMNAGLLPLFSGTKGEPMFSRRSAAAIPALLLLALLGAVAPARADYLYDNFATSGNAFDISTGYALLNHRNEGGNIFHSTMLAVPFTLGATNYTLDTISVAVASVGGTPAFTLDLVADSAGLPGSTVLESFTGITPTGTYGSLFTPETVTSSGHPMLDANTKYWVVAQLDAPTNNFDGWMVNNTGALGAAANIDSGSGYGGWGYGSTDVSFAMSVTGTALPVPEPRFYQMGLLLVMGGYAGLRLRRKRAAATQTPE